MATLTAPDAVAMDSQKLERVKQLFQQQIDETSIPAQAWRCTVMGTWCWIFMVAWPTKNP